MLDIPYSGKVWQIESLANLVNHLQFAKLKPSKVVVTIKVTGYPLNNFVGAKI